MLRASSYNIGFILLIFVVCFTSTTDAQYISDVTVPNSEKEIIQDDIFNSSLTITADDLSRHLYYLASDELGGRELGTAGNLMAAEYIADHFESLGLSTLPGTDSYFQEVDFAWINWDEASITANGTRYKQLWDFVAFQNANHGSEFQTEAITFLGYGIEDENYTDYKKADVEGKVILIYNGEPKNKQGQYRITESDEPSAWSQDLNRKLETAAKYGVKHVLIVAENIQKLVEDNRRQLLGAQVLLDKPENLEGPVDYTFVSSTMAQAILGEKGTKKVIKRQKCITKRGKSKPVEVDVDLQITQRKKVRQISGVNVAAMIEGKTKPEEYVFITAHYDHIGKKGRDINNGADDNGSGTSSILEIAEAYTMAARNGQRPDRSIVFMLVTGEEKGLLGSQYYVANPIVPLEQTMVDINVDMVGRIHKDYEDQNHYIFVIGSDRLSQQLHEVNEAVNEDYSKLVMDYRYNDERDRNRFYYRSDHYNFARNGIPAIFFFNGTHEDYHRPSDTPDKINYDIMSERARHIYRLSWRLGDLPERLKLNPQP